MRLNRFLAICGLGSRRGCEQIVLDGRVMVNGQRVKSLATVVEDGDQVSVDGKPVRKREEIIVALNKPKGYICTRADEEGRQTIYDLLPARFQHLHHVGRLDQDSDGLILLTNSGELSQRLTHPSKGVEKEYEVRTVKAFKQEHIAPLLEGMETPEGFARAERAWIEHAFLVHIVLKQGLKRQIRHMIYQSGNEVDRLTRTRIGGIKLKGLSKGGWRVLSENEIKEGLKSRPTKSQAKTQVVTSGEDDDHFSASQPAVAPRSSRRTPRRTASTRSSNPKPYVPREKFHDSKGKTGAKRPASSKRGKPRR